MSLLWSEKVKLCSFKNLLTTSLLINIFSDRVTQAALELASQPKQALNLRSSYLCLSRIRIKGVGHQDQPKWLTTVILALIVQKIGKPKLALKTLGQMENLYDFAPLPGTATLDEGATSTE